MSAFCTCLDEFGANPPDDPCPLHGANEPDDAPVCSNGSEECAAAEDNWCCPACWSDRKDDAAIEREEARREDEALDHDAGHWWEP